MRASYWFVECDPVSNEHLAELLKKLGHGAEAEESKRIDTRGKMHNVWAVPSELVKYLKTAKRQDIQRALHQFKFFVASTANGTLRSADFIEKRKRSRHVKKVYAEIANLMERKAS